MAKAAAVVGAAKGQVAKTMNDLDDAEHKLADEEEELVDTRRKLTGIQHQVDSEKSDDMGVQPASGNIAPVDAVIQAYLGLGKSGVTITPEIAQTASVVMAQKASGGATEASSAPTKPKVPVHATASNAETLLADENAPIAAHVHAAKGKHHATPAIQVGDVAEQSEAQKQRQARIRLMRSKRRRIREAGETMDDEEAATAKAILLLVQAMTGDRADRFTIEIMKPGHDVAKALLLDKPKLTEVVGLIKTGAAATPPGILAGLRQSFFRSARRAASHSPRRENHPRGVGGRGDIMPVEAKVRGLRRCTLAATISDAVDEDIPHVGRLAP